MPRLTIVTIVKNHQSGLQKTIESVRMQLFRDFEYIAVDGASTDGTPGVIKENSDIFSKVISEPDKGIYDAMNKGLAEASGDYIIFMNAGDVFACEKSLSYVFSAVKDSPDVIYGDYAVDYGFMTRHAKGGCVSGIWKGMISSHQAVFVKTEKAKRYKFDLRYKLGADFDMIYRIYAEGGVFRYVPAEIAVTESGGLSDKKRLTVYRNHLDTLKNHGVTLYQRAYYLYMFADAWFRLTLKRVLPLKIVKKIIAMKADR